jgi:DNA-binding PadR family transcriptional regulator
MSDDDLSPFLPLTTAALHILLALSGQDRHGYGIMQEIGRQTAGKYKPGPGTLYETLEKLLNSGLIDEVHSRAKGEDPRRRYYRMTKLGQKVLAEEVQRLDAVVRTAKANLGVVPARKTL